MTNPYSCPDNIADAMNDSCQIDRPLLWAVKTLGPTRVRWIGRPSKLRAFSEDNMPTYWSLDGKRATHGELMDAAMKHSP